MRHFWHWGSQGLPPGTAPWMHRITRGVWAVVTILSEQDEDGGKLDEAKLTKA